MIKGIGVLCSGSYTLCSFAPACSQTLLLPGSTPCCQLLRPCFDVPKSLSILTAKQAYYPGSANGVAMDLSLLFFSFVCVNMLGV